MYSQTEVFEPIEVIVYFNDRDIEILKFKWKNKVFKVSEILNVWQVPDGDSFSTHFVTVCKENKKLCELSFDHTNTKWELIQYDTL